MSLSREQALAALGLSATPEADSATIQKAFERLARRYPQPHFPERFHQLLEARDQLLSPERTWRELMESRTLDLTWILPHVAKSTPQGPPDRRNMLQALMRAGLLAEPVDESVTDDDDDDDDFPFF